MYFQMSVQHRRYQVYIDAIKCTTETLSPMHSSFTIIIIIIIVSKLDLGKKPKC
jgi:hypothetical protein